jgi:hypothetical protein
MSSAPTHNDKAWEQLFEEHRILEHINRDGLYTITSAQINKVRESRLMAKFDHHVNLPDIFRQHDLSILPISRSQYVIGYFETHQQVASADEIEAIPIQPPAGIESLDPANVYSEAAALSFAYHTEMIDALIGEPCRHTVGGRMSTEAFSFSIQSTRDGMALYQIKVDNSQCEIDGGFESEQYFVLVEAKNYAVDDFLIRQLYYPYRLWSSKLSKKVIPVLMTFSNDMFDLFVYEFRHPDEYNSIQLVRQVRYALAPEAIQRSDVDALFSSVRGVEEPDDVPLPQADRFDRVVDVLAILASKDLTKDEITRNYAFDGRQTQYYTNAARYLGLIERYEDQATREVTFRLTDEARSLLKLRHKAKHLKLMRKILEHELFYKTFQWTLQQGAIPEEEVISQIILGSQIKSQTRKPGASPTISGSTIGRRASTVRGWVEWIWNQIEE